MTRFLIPLVIASVGILIASILFLRSKWKIRQKDIKEYEEGRDKLSFRKGEVIEEPKEEESDGFSLGSVFIGLISLALVIYVGLVILSSFESTLTSSTAINNTSNLLMNNVTSAMGYILSGETFGSGSTILAVLTIIFVMIIISRFFMNFTNDSGML